MRMYFRDLSAGLMSIRLSKLAITYAMAAVAIHLLFASSILRASERLLIPTVPPFPAVQSNGNTYHVSKDIGRDSVDSGSAENPWASMQYGIDRLTEGDTLIVHEAFGGYNEYMTISNTGAPDKWITIKAAEGEQVVLGGGRITFGSAAKYIYIKNIDIISPDAGWRMIEIKGGAEYLALSGMEIDCQSSTANYTAVWTNGGVNNVWFQNMDIHHCGYKKENPTDCSGVCLKKASSGDTTAPLDNIVFLDVTVRDNRGDGIGGWHVSNIYFNGVTADNNTGDGFDIGAKVRAVFKNSIAKNNGPEHQGNGFKSWSKESWFINIIATNNTYHGIVNKPLHRDSSIHVINSTFLGNNKYKSQGQLRLRNLFSEEQPDISSTKIYIYNNIFHTTNTSSVCFEDWSNQSLVGEDHNYYFAAEEEGMPRAHNWAITIRDSVLNVVSVKKTYSVAELEDGAWFRDAGHGKNDIVGETTDDGANPDPGFIRLPDDLHLLSRSRAIDAGFDYGVMEDFDGKSRPRGLATDIGAYEFESGHDRPSSSPPGAPILYSGK